MGDQPGKSIPISPLEVPSFLCVIFVRRDGEGQINARVANLLSPDGQPIAFQGSSEREVLGKVIPRFKQIIALLHASGDGIEWIDPVPEPSEGEQKRLVPVHL